MAARTPKTTFNLPTSVKIVEVGPRDGLQNEHDSIDLNTKVSLIERLQESGITNIEIGSFVSPSRIPQMADSDRVFKNIKRKPHYRYIALVVNQQGLAKALSYGIKDIAVFCAASNTFSLKNVNRTLQENLDKTENLCRQAKANNMWVRGYISCVLGCPYEGAVSVKLVSELARKLDQFGCDEISLGDTIGVGTPGTVKPLIEAIGNKLPLDNIAVHFHDTYGQSLANILTAMQMGISIIDSAVAGLGGCPFAPGASGNVATEDLIYMLNGLGINSGVNLDLLISTAWFISKKLNRPPISKVSRALAKSEFSESITV